MAGGEGTRLRPMTSSQPKVLLPIATQPVMEHVLHLLKRHGFTETIVTVQFLASLVRNYFGDGEDLGMDLQYATEETPRGTAGSVKNAEDALRSERFLVISGDALTDIDLTDLVHWHEERNALVTVCLTRVPDPLEFGITILDDDGKVDRFLEKPTWGQVFSDTVNTGIYVMEPEVFDYVPAGENVDWSADVFPALIAANKPVYGYVADGYWQDVGTQESYFSAQADVLSGRVEVTIDGFEVSPDVWIGEGTEVHPDANIVGPVIIGDYAKVEAGAKVHELTVIGSNVVVKGGATLERAVIHDNVYVGAHAQLRGCIIGKNTDIMRAARVEEGAVIGDECMVEEEAIVGAGVKIYPFKSVEAGAVVHQSVIWESRGQASLFGPRGVSGIINVEITPELAVRLASAFATTLRKGATVTVGRDVSRAARALKRAVIAALTSSALDVRDLELSPEPVTRMETAQGSAGGIMVRTTPGIPDNVDIQFLDERGNDLSQAAQRRLERIFQRQEYRRAFPGEIGDLTIPSRVLESYAQELLRAVDTSGIAEADLKVVVDTAGGAAALALPTLLGRLGVDVLTMNNRIDEARPTETAEERRAGLRRLGSIVASSGAAFGARFDPVAERIALVDERGHIVEDDRALLVVLDLVAAEKRHGAPACRSPPPGLGPVARPRRRDPVDDDLPDDLTRHASGPNVALCCDGRGGFVVPEFSGVIDGMAAFVRVLGLVARAQLTLSQIDARIPQAHVLRQDVETPWAAKGQVMRSVIEAAGDRIVDTTDGVRIVEEDRRWALVLPDPTQAITRVWAEGPDAVAAKELVEEWSTVVEQAAHAAPAHLLSRRAE